MTEKRRMTDSCAAGSHGKRLFYLGCVALCLLCSSLQVRAQQTAVKAVADGHWMGAKEQLERWMAEPGSGRRGGDGENGLRTEQAEALMLVCDYVLDAKGVADRMGEWTGEHPLSPWADVLRVLRRNRLLKEGRAEEALDLFMEDEARGFKVNVPLPYPLESLTDEMSSCNEVFYRLAGERLYEAGRHEAAVGYLEMGEKTRTSRYKLGMCYYRMGMMEKAKVALKESAEGATDEMAQSAWLHVGLSALLSARGQEGVRTVMMEEAQGAFRAAAAMTASATLREQALYNYALTLHEQNAPGTVAAMEQFLKDFPASGRATAVSQCLTEVYMTRKDYGKALSAISRVQSPDAETQGEKQKVLYRLAVQELNRGAVQQALTYAAQAVALGNKDAETYAESYYILGDCHYRLGNYQQAENDLTTALNLGMQTARGGLNNDGYARYTLGYALMKQQKYHGAIVHFKRTTETAEMGQAMRADAWNRLGDCHLNMRDYDEAVACYAKAKETDHALGDYAMLQQAYIEGLKGNYAKKVEMIGQMQAEYPASGQGAKALFEQGRAYVLMGQEDEAAAVFSTIAMRYPGHEYAKKASEELANMAQNIAMRDSIAAAQDSIATEAAKAPVAAAQQLFDAGQHQQAEQVLNKAIDEGIGKPYWLARAFVLLSDIYKAEGRTVEARQTLESLKANYKEDDDIGKMIEERMKE
ncbi:MAG: tetratricopeptide repeat protein [Bacteroidaceae bacterium]|nr:tetratricopeptide repeat protein [Bacteroidaceae bacterium]